MLSRSKAVDFSLITHDLNMPNRLARVKSLDTRAPCLGIHYVLL